MPILEGIMQPLIKASEARGEARGRAAEREAAAEEFQRWKQQQISKGVVFVDTKDGNDPDDATRQPTT